MLQCILIPELVGDYAKLIPAKIRKNYQTQLEVFCMIIHTIKNCCRGRQHIVDNFNWLKITEEYENIISKTINDFINANL